MSAGWAHVWMDVIHVWTQRGHEEISAHDLKWQVTGTSTTLASAGGTGCAPERTDASCTSEEVQYVICLV